MSKDYEGQDPLVIAQQAERDLNSHGAKHGLSSSESGTSQLPRPAVSTNVTTANESGVDTNVTEKFPGSTVKVGSAASGAGDNREIPVDEGGDIISKSGEKGRAGLPTKARDFEGAGGPEDKQRIYEEANPGNEDVLGNVRQGTETRRP